MKNDQLLEDCTFESSKLAEGSVNNLTTLSYKTAPIPIGGSIHTSPKFIHRQTNTTKDSSTDENSYSLIPSEKLIELPGFIPGSSTNDICRSTQYPIFVKHSSKLHPSHTSAQAEETTRKLPSTQNYEIHRPETCIGQQVFPDEALTKASAGDESARKSDSSLYSMETYAFQNTTDVNISGSQSQKNVVQNNVKTSETVRFTQHRNRKFWKQMIMAPNHLPADHSVVDMINIQEYNVEPSKLNTESSMQQKLSVPYGKQKRKHCDVKTSWLRPYVGQSTQSSLQNVTVSELRSFCEAKKQIVSLRNSMQMNDGRKRFASPSTGDVSQTAVELVSKDWRSDPRFNRGFHSGLMPAQSNSKCAMSVTASTPIGHLGNVARLTLFTLKSESDDTVNNTWPFPATLENRIPASSPEAQLLPECLQLAMHPHYGRTQKRRPNERKKTAENRSNSRLRRNLTFIRTVAIDPWVGCQNAELYRSTWIHYFHLAELS
ncbi:uncharacterized protein DEA37_0015120 [Paragonimus westermani]|uniref:Uncharacterized protein n=1 Tax=Paragonimus westermani TaxID=34504 RepID=A0A5J4NPU0_9TREM|nr:uncharacterized protein DEA37_0015120 [Paragonimus westermani]